MTPIQAQVDTRKTDLPAGRWLVDARGEAIPYIPFYVDENGLARAYES